MKGRVFILWYCLMGVIAASLSCDESLPRYSDPTKVLEANNAALYVISTTDNSLKVFVNVTNTYDETFDGRAFIDGTVSVTMSGNQSFRKTFIINSSNIVSGNYNPSSQQLRIDPGDTLKLTFSWNFFDDNGRDIRDIVAHYEDKTCIQRRISDQLTFTIRSEVKVYEKVAAAVAQTIAYTFVHHDAYFNPGWCTPAP
ncbi:MAG: hypothetical protein MN733_38035 [Nitrososphaera sp.]|nr:hypothetical protein [Nitrososphaera sp.]MCI0708450.1 hypothetical protein [Ignavibacteriota bacterium]